MLYADRCVTIDTENDFRPQRTFKNAAPNDDNNIYFGLEKVDRGNNQQPEMYEELNQPRKEPKDNLATFKNSAFHADTKDGDYEKYTPTIDEAPEKYEELNPNSKPRIDPPESYQVPTASKNVTINDDTNNTSYQDLDNINPKHKDEYYQDLNVYELEKFHSLENDFRPEANRKHPVAKEMNSIPKVQKASVAKHQTPVADSQYRLFNR